MEWLSAENLIAVGTAVLGVLASIGVLWYERRVPRRKRLGYRVQLDSPIGSDGAAGQPNVRQGLFDFDGAGDMADATLVLLRFENNGSQAIAATDYDSGGPDGLIVEFENRTVRGIAVSLPQGGSHLLGYFSRPPGAPPQQPGTLRHEGSRLYLPRVPLNSRRHFKLLVLLGGGATGSPIHMIGDLAGGDVVETQSTTVDDTPPLFSRPARLLTVLLTVCVVTLSTLVMVRGETPPPIGCEKGSLKVVGSTAFKPVADELAAKYEQDCPGSEITVDARGSAAGIAELKEAGAEQKTGSPAVVTFADGPPSSPDTKLTENRVAVTAFAMVLNDKVALKNLSVTDLRRLYRGEIRNWSRLGGPDLPVVLVSRNSNSGTRGVFQRRILRGFEPAASSSDCHQKDDGRAKVFRCELDSTDQVLATVADIPGAIGYSELRTGTAPKGAHHLSLDGHAPTLDDIARSPYPFREIEYAHTYGRPPADSLASSFLNYAMRGSGQDVVRTHGHLPCYTPEGLKVCGS
ncbi:substrate-binding domain-containing protein [Streptomyces sp. TRM66268-LWL]|uniref:Substrate-binding domain-containing protein n=1 Tax=Streptomyces polyasparticus TaxID=2767826 RepID=A0ABR7SJP9_9ACTN|nr:substrate-binding domain-containing protein [Streptomyces polyasparticus]MBC9714563.1 substrate-binding domain-containing protein [Streptomyces polyasparticus]